MRTLTPAAQTERDTKNAPSCYILQIDHGDACQYFSGQDLGAGDGTSLLNACGRVRSWGKLRYVLDQKGKGSIGNIKITLEDFDHEFFDLTRARRWDKIQAHVWLCFTNAPGEGSLIYLLGGCIAEPIIWRRDAAELRLDIVDLGLLWDAPIGVVADVENFPYVESVHEDRVLPLVFGRCKRVPLGYVRSAPKATLQKRMTREDTTFIVDDASRFPRGQITVQINYERMTGSFSGATFTCTARGVDVTGPSTVTTAVDAAHWIDINIGGFDNEYVNFHLKVLKPVDGEWDKTCRITHYGAATGAFTVLHQLLDGGVPWTMPMGQQYWIGTWKTWHLAGSTVRLVSGGAEAAGHVYIANERPSKQVRRVFGRGQITLPGTIEDRQIEADITIEPSYYTVNRYDGQFIGILGHRCTTVTFVRDPKDFYPKLDTARLYADVDGVDSRNNGTGTLVDNPADVIKHILEVFLGVTPADWIDAASFATAKAALSHYHVAFCHSRIRSALEVCADIAFQSHMSLLGDDGTFRVIVLSNAIGAASKTIDGQNHYDSKTFEITHIPAFEVVTEVIGDYYPGIPEAFDRSVVIKDTAAETEYGRNILRITFWAYQARHLVKTSAMFWLQRLKFAAELVRLRGFLSLCDVQPNDVVELGEPTYFAAGQKALVLAVEAEPAMGVRGTRDAVGLVLRLPTKPGCITNCETDCQSDCQADCQVACQTALEGDCDECQTECQGLCQLECVTAAELPCGAGDTIPMPELTTTSTSSTTTSHEHTTTTTTSHIHSTSTSTSSPHSTSTSTSSSSSMSSSSSTTTTTTSHEHSTSTTSTMEAGLSECCRESWTTYYQIAPDGEPPVPADCPATLVLPCNYRFGDSHARCPEADGYCYYSYHHTPEWGGDWDEHYWMPCVYKLVNDTCYSSTTSTTTSTTSTTTTTPEPGPGECCPPVPFIAPGPIYCPGGVGDCPLTMSDLCITPPCVAVTGCYYSNPECFGGICQWNTLDSNTCVYT